MPTCLKIYYFLIYYLSHLRTNIVHPPHPSHLVGGFELFRDTFLFGVFFYQPRKEGLCFFLYIGEVGM